MVWGPPGLTPGRVVSDLIDITDIFPTVCQLSKTSIPESIPYRGTSFVPQLHGRRGILRTWVHHGFQNGVAVTDGKWRLDNSGVLRDSSKLPAEPVASPGAEADAVRIQLNELLDAEPDASTSALDGWRALHFGAYLLDSQLESTLWGHLADPDHDNLSNEFEYLLGFDPLRADAAGGLLSLSRETLRPSVHAITRTDDSLLAAALQSSRDLGSWVAADRLLDLKATPALNRSFVESCYQWPEGTPVPDLLMLRFESAEAQ